MTWQVSSEDDPVQQGVAPRALRVLGVVAVCMGVAALAVATFILSYSDIRTVALQAGIQPKYAKTYPLLIDAMLVIALAAVLALRGAGVPSRILSWLTLLVVLGAAAGAGVLHATGREIPHQAAATTAAVLPWALVLVAFVLLLAMLRHARLRRQLASLDQVSYAVTVGPEPQAPALPGPGQPYLAPPAQPLPVRTPQSWQSASIVPGFTSRLVSSAAAGAARGAIAADIDPFPPLPVARPAEDDAAVPEAEPGNVDETSEADAGPGDADPGPAEATLRDAQPEADSPYDENVDDDMPVFHRMWSPPTPPEE